MMDFAYSPKTLDLQSKLREFMEGLILPNNERWHREVEEGVYPIELIDDLKVKAKAHGLWNLFLPGLRDDEPGTRLTNLEYAPLAEIMGRFPWSAEVFNCSAPDTGNMEILHMFATPQQREQWLKPLLEGDIRSVVSITEPDVASSDPTNLRTSIVRDGAHYVINGRKWFNTGAMHPRARVLIVLGVQYPRRASEARLRRRPVDSLEVHGTVARSTIANVEDLPSQPR